VRPTLSLRQVQVLQLTAEGLTYSQTGERLQITEGAAANHFYRARIALGGRTPHHTLALAREYGLLNDVLLTPTERTAA
jgi:DNA-binding CsgD family transcriptional regulator